MLACAFVESRDAQGGGSEKEGGEACMQCAVLGGVFVSVPGCQRNTQRMRLLLHLSDNGCAA